MTEITQPGLFMETPEIIQPDPALAYVALARHVAAIDMALKCGPVSHKVFVLIRAEAEAAMEVIHHYENSFIHAPSPRP